MRTIRQAVVSGTFYHDSAKTLVESMEASFLHQLGPGKLPAVNDTGPRQLVGLVCPHAGFQYSGAAAAWSYQKLAEDGKPDVVVILGTNHRLVGALVSLSSVDYWETPLGQVPVDKTLTAALEKSGLFELDDLAHEYEHSIEVQLPWLQLIYGDAIAICPISLGRVGRRLIKSLVQILTETLAGKNAVLIASSDFSHYIPQDQARATDREAIDAILALKPEHLLDVVESKNISMCGVIGVAIMLATAKQLGAKTGELLCYYTSGDMMGDKSSVVGYSSIILK